MPQELFEPRKRIESEYRSLILKLLDRYLAIPEWATLGQINEALVRWSQISRFFEQAAESIAARMVTQTKIANARNWREAARKGSRGREIYESLRSEMGTEIGFRVEQLVRENAALISSLPEEIREATNREIARMTQEGLRASNIAKYLQKRVPEITRSRAMLVARTETAKANTALVQARSEELSVPWYQWETSRDGRVRRSHRHMQSVLVSWDDPPSPEKLVGEKSKLGAYHAGSCPNCRCYPEVLLRLSNVQWPKKVYSNGRIQSMTRTTFYHRFLEGTSARIFS
jgi:SPP1 gp7 family putative phage head morphogenesis protein